MAPFGSGLMGVLLFGDNEGIEFAERNPVVFQRDILPDFLSFVGASIDSNNVAYWGGNSEQPNIQIINYLTTLLLTKQGGQNFS